MNIKLIISMIPIMTILGCSSPQVIEPQPFSSENSYAYNIANQTALTKPYSFGIKTYDSPLKDFTLEEKEAANQVFNKKSNAGSMLSLSLITALSGNPMLALGGAGTSGLLAMTNSQHIASKPTWIISVKKSDFGSKLEAQKFIINNIKTATINELEKYGEVKQEQAFKNHPNWETFVVKIDGQWIRSGLNIQSESVSTDLLTERKVLRDGKMVDAYTYGYGAEISNLNTTLVTVPLPILIARKMGEEQDFDQIINSITTKLPKGFYLYYIPFPTVKQGDQYYINTLNPLPTIYTQGKKYEFLKPTP
ncbi:hypothetical protein [Vibrio algicola]|uniref:Lipoprotein n=1 Tax=Vibrio algicola TaxID=2662262 RepID=A0A5Q0TEH4_9VIBR|nr:hypothetical protein [Vibrio algicola]